MLRTILSFYSWKLPVYLVYMLQQVEYDPKKFLSWLGRIFKQQKLLSNVMHRKTLVLTKKAKALLVFMYTFVAVYVVLSVVLSGYRFEAVINILVDLIILPDVLIVVLAIVTYLAHRLIVRPAKIKLIAHSKKIFENHTAVKVAVIGSYGKTTMKELLYTILKEGKKVAATPGNMNVAVSHARFAQKLKGDEDVLIIEFGEGEPGDVAEMTQTVQPDYAVITGLAPNHLDYYPSLKSVAGDLLSVYDHVDSDSIFVTKESSMLQKFISSDMNQFSIESVMGWQIKHILVSVKTTSFVMNKGTKELRITTGLLGRHQVAPVAFGAALADKLGLSKKQIETGCKNIQPYEHRVQPRYIHGAWLIDDTYNGNLEGLQAGLKLLHELDMKRKWYVTPGLVDQGDETERVHIELGKSIVQANPDIVVLMDNSARTVIEKSLKDNDFKGELRIESDPLEFYTNIEHIVAAGDLVLMQNDWTDNYN